MSKPALIKCNRALIPQYGLQAIGHELSYASECKMLLLALEPESHTQCTALILGHWPIGIGITAQPLGGILQAQVPESQHWARHEECHVVDDQGPDQDGHVETG